MELSIWEASATCLHSYTCMPRFSQVFNQSRRKKDYSFDNIFGWVRLPSIVILLRYISLYGRNCGASPLHSN